MLNWVAACLAVAIAFGQRDGRPRFEVASVKVSAPDGRPHMSFSPGRAVLTHVRLQDMVPFVYGVQPFLVSGGPGWMATEHFDLVGKLPVVAGMPAPGRAEALQALQVLLEERFRLKLHWETKTMPLYRITVAKSGFNLKDGEALPVDTAGGFMTNAGVRLVQRGTGLATLASMISRLLDEPVEDTTGLQGSYSFVLEWQRNHSGGNVDEDGIIGALRSQLGLNLERGKGPVKILVIDSAERPQEN